MNTIERALGILLLLSGGQRRATELAERFGVSVRTIYRDVDRLIALGIPVEAERGAYSRPSRHSRSHTAKRGR